MKATSLKIEIFKCVETADFKIFGALPDEIIPQSSYSEVRDAPIFAPDSNFAINDFIRDGYHYKASLKNFDTLEMSFDFAAKSHQIPLLGEFTLFEIIQLNLKLPLFRVFMVDQELELELHPIFNQQATENQENKPCFLRNQD